MIRGRVLRAAQWLKRYRKPPRLQSVLMGMMTLIITLCLFATVFFSYQSYKEILVQQVASSRNDVLLQVSAKVESLQQNMVTISNLYYYAIKDFEPGLPETRIPALERFSQDYQSALLAIDPGCYVSVIGKNGLHYASAPVELKHLDQQMWFLRIPTQMKESDLFWTQSHREEDGSYSFSLARRIVGGDGVMYTLLVSVPERTIFGTYENIISNNALYVVRQDGRIVSQNSEKMVDLNYFNMDRLDATM